MNKQVSFPRGKMKILLLEGVHAACVDRLNEAGYQAELLKNALSEDELVARIPGVHILGIRSKTRVSKRVLEAADDLLSIGCFCIGTDQVDLGAAASHGVPVLMPPSVTPEALPSLPSLRW
jgi:D-3-phosphoglycerate dehydrogenase